MSGVVAIQGERGSNSDAAARLLLGDDVALSCCASFGAAFRVLDEVPGARAVLPVENTTAGLVQEVCDRLVGVVDGPPLAAHAEARVRITFVAACLPGARATARRILAHPVAAAQCGRFLASTGLEVSPCHDTAGAARLVREGGDPTTAALCPPGAARVYGLEAFAEDVGDARRTATRFLLVERGDPRPHDDDDRSLVALSLPDRPGSLLRALEAFATGGLNLCALHSRAVPGKPGTYAFLLEVEAGGRAAGFDRALAAVASTGAGARLVGSWRAPPWPEMPSA